jgi:NitT/TauT family transport system substrate-binding protein
MIVLCICSSCKTQSKISVIVPQGSPELAITYIKNDDNYRVDVVIGADPLVAAFSSQSHDVIIAPTNLGAKLYQSTPSYIMLAVLVEGNYYLASRSKKLDTFADIENQQVVIFGKNQPSDIIMTYLLNQLKVTCNITYVDNVTTAQSMLVLDENLIILTAEPSLSVLESNFLDLNTLELISFYENAVGESYPQAGVFIKSDLNSQTINQIEYDFRSSTENVNTLPSEAAHLAVQSGVMLEEEVIEHAITRSNINYLNAWDAKSSIENFFLIIESINPALIGNTLPNDGFYDRGDDND